MRPAAPAPAVTRAATRRRASAEPLDRGNTAVPVAEHKLDETLPGREPARARAGPERKTRLAQLRLHHQRAEASRADPDGLDTNHLRCAGHSERGVVAAGFRARPALPDHRVTGQHGVVAVGHEVEGREQVTPPRGWERPRT